MPRNHRQEALSSAYMQAIAAQCGMACSFPRVYDYGIDLTLHEIRRHGSRYVESGFRLDVQAKSTSARMPARSHVPYDLDVKTYDDLRDAEVGCPRILVLLVVPEVVNRWTTQTEGQLVLRYCAYWMSLRGQGPTANRRTVRVAIPRANAFSARGLARLMDRVKRREPL